MTPPPKRSQLFISYSHRDGGWVERLRTMLRPLEHRYGLERWDDSRIQPGSLWREEIEKALASARVALLLVSSDFLASDFVTRSELPQLFHAAKQEGLRILWVPLRPCLWKEIPEIEQYQAAINPGSTLARMTEVEQEEAFVQIAEEIKKVFQEEAERQALEEVENQRLEAQRAAHEQRKEEERPAMEEAEWLLQKIGEIRATPLELRKATAEEVRRANLLMKAAFPAGPRTRDSWPLQRFSTTTCLLRQEGSRWREVRRPLQVEGYRGELAEGVPLSMVEIPAGTFQMGSPEGDPERSDDEGPQHEVSLGAFYLAQTPITQAQWKVVAGWQKVQRDLNPDPSRFKGSNRPVEQVNWHDAMEFCSRLSQRTGKRYGLPSEAQWEYACRAGSTTPFHFGATLTPDLANYNGNFTYGDGPKGTHREQTTDVASFPANGWGLHDMHGNVWEWCADHWHGSYDFAPGDHQPWLIPAAAVEESRLLRGGSWDCRPGSCRSAFRSSARPDFAYDVGFRVVNRSLIQDLL
jgi:formylglycine-generating enzyme required for sulfatase activity